MQKTKAVSVVILVVSALHEMRVAFHSKYMVFHKLCKIYIFNICKTICFAQVYVFAYAKVYTLYKTYSFAYAKYIVLRKYMVLHTAKIAHPLSDGFV